jgi:hypothetical protein
MRRSRESELRQFPLLAVIAAPEPAGGDFDPNWDGLTVGQLFERIRTTMPQDNAEVLRVIRIDASKPEKK